MSDLHPRLAEDCIAIAMFPLSRLLLMDDSRFPWLLLVPDREAITDIGQLEDHDQQQLFLESMALNRAMHRVFSPDRMNIACIGNVVSQLHVHHVARYQHDACWPAPVWGHCQNQGSAVPYSDKDSNDVVNRLKTALDVDADFSIHWLTY